jgi:hypothetical protein
MEVLAEKTAPCDACAHPRWYHGDDGACTICGCREYAVKAGRVSPATVTEPTPHGEGADIAALVCRDLRARGGELAELLCADIEARAEVGRAKYGQRLRASNGRRGLVDLYQELLGAAMYVRQVIEEEGE